MIMGFPGADFEESHIYWLLKGPVEYFSQIAPKCSQCSQHQQPAGMFKKVVQQGHSHFDARSVHLVREHGKMARTPLAAFFNIPLRGQSLIPVMCYIFTKFF